MSLIHTPIEPFSATAYQGGEFIEVSERSVSGRWSVFFFYPADFTFVCPTELQDLSELYADFQSLGVEIYAVSTDTHFAHKAWADSSPTIAKLQYPLVGDPSGRLARAFGVLNEDEGLAQRATFAVNPEGRIVAYEVHEAGIGRDARELLRKLRAAQHVAAHPGEVCPARWRPGEATLEPSPDLVGKL